MSSPDRTVTRRRLLAALSGSLGAAGCLSRGRDPDAGEPGTDTPAASATPGSPGNRTPDRATDPDPETTARATTDATPAATTAERFAASAGDASVEYVVRPGEVPETVASTTVTLRAVVVEVTDDLGPCYPEVFTGPYKPTITPLPAPEGDCHRSERASVDLAELDGEHSLGAVPVPDAAAGHALVLTGVDATRPDGTAIDAILGIGGLELLESPEPPDGPHGVEIGLEPSNYGFDYAVMSTRFDPSG
jgi:hypothetical protein